MVKSDAGTVQDYLDELPDDRRESMQAVRQVVLDNLPDGYEEMMLYGMIGWAIPLEVYPETYNGHPLAYASLGNQKNYMSLYLMNVYGDEVTEEWFKERYAASGKKLNMGKSCVRFKRADDLPLDLIGEVISRTPAEDYIRYYEQSRANMKSNRRRKKKS